MVTSAVLYITPHGRVAYWTDWRLWGLTKTDWSNIHTNLGVLFILSLILHTYYNWKAILLYLKNKEKRVRVFTKEFNIAFVIAIAFLLGTYFHVPPFAWVINISETIKDAGTRKYGEPPYGHAELSSLKTFIEKMGLDFDDSIDNLKKAEIKFESEEQSLEETAKLNNTSPQNLYEAMKPDKKVGEKMRLPDEPTPGFGKRTISDICREYNIGVKTVIKNLASHNIKVDENMNIKKIAERHDQSPIDIYEAIKTIVNNKIK